MYRSSLKIYLVSLVITCIKTILQIPRIENIAIFIEAELFCEFAIEWSQRVKQTTQKHKCRRRQMCIINENIILEWHLYNYIWWRLEYQPAEGGLLTYLWPACTLYATHFIIYFNDDTLPVLLGRTWSLKPSSRELKRLISFGISLTYLTVLG